MIQNVIFQINWDKARFNTSRKMFLEAVLSLWQASAWADFPKRHGAACPAHRTKTRTYYTFSNDLRFLGFIWLHSADETGTWVLWQHIKAKVEFAPAPSDSDCAIQCQEHPHTDF